MPDIAKCDGFIVDEDDKKCPFIKTCYRYVCPPSEFQSYFTRAPFDPKENECIEYMDIIDRIRKGKKDAS